VTAQAAAEVEDIGGDLQAAEAVLREGRDELARLGEWGSRSTHEALRALYLADLGRRDEAAAAIAECRRLASPDDVASRATSDQAEALLRSAAGDHAAAVALARGAVELERHADSTRDVARCHATLGRVLAAAGETEAARAELACAADLYDRKGIAVLAAAVRTRCAALPGPPGGP
jgi:tetratricopeptide (TPR) repeat protein